ncbi:MAG TPA: (d)CMP kinase [Lachnospiraceae bacterium]|nr:(d)CMP kinase [Lachnospiraceae bacterium]
MSVNIAIDGPAGAGKSTVAKNTARALGCIYVDTGAMYRAMALYLLRQGIDPSDTPGIEEACESVDITIDHEEGVQKVLLNGEDVSSLIRTEEVGKMASVSSANGRVREKLTALQKKLAREKDVVMDGRDIGTVVLPDAQVKLYLTADAHVRAERRFKELVERGETPDIGELERDIIERDHRDMTREISPLKRADDAILIDSSALSIDETTERITEIIREKTGLWK